MPRSVLLPLQLYVTAAAFPWVTTSPPSNSSDEVPKQLSADPAVTTLLRGSNVADTQSAVSIAASKVELKTGVPRGHLFYAKECVDCFYKGAQCGCEPSMEYLACLTTHCHKPEDQQFLKMCSVLESHCFGELDIDCRGHDTVCRSKFQQLPSGGLGIAWDPDAILDDAFCGPFGNCIGDIHLQVNIHSIPQADAPSRPTKAREVKMQSSTEPKRRGPEGLEDLDGREVNPAAVKEAVKIVKADLPCNKSEKVREVSSAPSAPTHPGIWLECGLPVVAKANIDRKEDWTICATEAKDGKAICDIPMRNMVKVVAQQSIEGYCVLTDGKSGKRLTQPLWRNIFNTNAPIEHTTASGPETETISVEQAVHKEMDASGEVKEEAIDAGDEAIRTAGDKMKDAREKKLPYIKDGRERPPPPDRYIVKETNDLKRLTQKRSSEVSQGAKKVSHEQSEKIKDGVSRAQTQAEKDAAKVREPIVKEAKDLEQSADETGAEVANEIDSASDKAAKKTKAAADASHEAVEKAAKAKPPYMKDSQADDKEPLPPVVVSAIVQSPFLSKFA